MADIVDIPRPPHKPEEDLTPEQILTREGAIFYPKRPLPIPEIALPALTHLSQIAKPPRSPGFPPLDADTLRQDLEPVIAYVRDGQPIGDSFGGNHHARTAWLDRMRTTYGQDVIDYYDRVDQLPANRITSVLTYIDLFVSHFDPAIQPQLAQRLTATKEKLYAVIHGRQPLGENPPVRYQDLPTVEKKLAVVRFLEDEIISLLEFLSRQAPELPISP